MMAVLSVTSAIARDLRATAPDQADPFEGWAERVMARIESDIQHARQIDVSEGQLVLTGYTFFDRRNQTWQHRPVRVTYVVDHGRDQPVLIRKQRRLDQEVVETDWQPLAVGVNGLRVDPVIVENDAAGEERDQKSEAVAYRIRLELIEDTKAEPTANERSERDGSNRSGGGLVFERELSVR